MYFLIVFPLVAQAGVRTAVVVDGQYDEWDLDKDCSIPMRSTRKGNGEILPNVYLRYDSITNTVFVLVLGEDGLRDGKRKPVVNIYSLGQDMPIGINGAGKISDFSWVMDQGKRVGWEGAFHMAPGTYDCDAKLRTTQGANAKSEAKKASEVEVIDTEELFIDCH
ncbi:MAG: hypothetical protein D3910_21775 [Candidatus Electrothrix sp. ATG2]|nr:hypothetical protein [Candidatus Electrothrix sp. ATG2]